MTFYTDGCNLLNGNTNSIGCFGFVGSDIEYTSKVFFGHTSQNMETMAILEVLDYSYVNKIKNIVIYSDCQSSIALITGNHKKVSSVFDLLAKNKYKKMILEGYQVKIEWIKAHSINDGNNQIDLLLESKLAQSILELPELCKQKILSKVSRLYLKKGKFENFSDDFFTTLLY